MNEKQQNVSSLKLKGSRMLSKTRPWPSREAATERETYENPGFIAAFAKVSRLQRLWQIVRKLTFDRFWILFSASNFEDRRLRRPADFRESFNPFRCFQWPRFDCRPSLILNPILWIIFPGKCEIKGDWELFQVAFIDKSLDFYKNWIFV